MPISLAALELTVDGKAVLTDFSATVGANGPNSLAYDNSTGAFTLTPATTLTDIGIVDGTAGQALITDGAGNFSFATMGAPTSALSVTTAAAGTAALTYNDTTGVFTYTPPDVSSYIALTDLQVLTAAAGTTSLTYDNTTGEFIYTPPDLSSYLTAETTTTLAYTSGTQTLTYTDEAGSATNIDLSGLLDDTNLVTSVNTQTGAVVLALTDLGITDGTSGQFLSTDGAGNFTFATPADLVGIALTDLSVTTATAGTAALAYDNSTGVFTYTPPDLTSIDSSTLTKPIALADDEKLTFGTNDDLEIFHSGSFSYIRDVGPGSVILNTNFFRIKNQEDTENMASFFNNGAVTLYYDNVAKLDTTADGVAITGKITGLTDPTAAQDAATKAYVDAAASGIALTDLSVTQNAAGTAGLSYDNTTGVFSYTPPDLSSYLTAETITLATLKTEVAASTDFTDFQARIAAL